jgi:undecaprenyl diphosphate synthase
MADDAPKYVAIITDGNGRWARRRGLDVGEGHRAGAETVRARLRDAVELGLRELPIYAFSTATWDRSPAAVRGLMDLMAEYIDKVTPELHAEGVQLRFIGRRREPVPGGVIERMERAEAMTAENDRITFFIPFNYGGRAEILDAARSFSGTTEEDFRRHLYAPDMHDPDLLIRTGGECRLSNYMLWQLAFSELVFREEMWPEFSRHAFESAIEEFRRRRRKRLGRAGNSPEP